MLLPRIHFSSTFLHNFRYYIFSVHAHIHLVRMLIILWTSNESVLVDRMRARQLMASLIQGNICVKGVCRKSPAKLRNSVKSRNISLLHIAMRIFHVHVSYTIPFFFLILYNENYSEKQRDDTNKNLAISVIIE